MAALVAPVFGFLVLLTGFFCLAAPQYVPSRRGELDTKVGGLLIMVFGIFVMLL
jgi:hypothetical protein